ncbi:DUF6179 domain-containing protein [Acetobacterium sp.]|uniref:DUF6179 domain-containing protein n=1 Tax=Acetobacterium sp. TaxID=1872094 RepID=UPI002F3F99A3
MQSIEKHSKINKQLLSNEFYFQSLLQEAHNQGELNDLEIESIQMQIIKLLADNTEVYNKGLSSSVKVEVAQTIMKSNMYTLSLYLKSFPEPDSSLDAVKSQPLSDLYSLGRSMINTKLNVAKYLYHLVCKTKIQTINASYNDTIGEEGIKGFFKDYHADYEAHETSGSIDYQLIHPITDLAGVEFIIQYLQNLHLENLFCSKFEPVILHEVMCGYHATYADLLVNIFGQALQNALGCAILHKEILDLNLEASDIRKIKNDLKNETKESILEISQQNAAAIIKTLGITSTSLKSYIWASLPEFTSNIHFAIKNDTLQKVLVPRVKTSSNEIIQYSIGTKTDDESYRKIVNEVRSCRYSDDKIEIIKEQFKTLSDIEDILLDCALSESEAFVIFSMLDDVELSVLVKRHPYHPEINAIAFSEPEIILQQYLDNYLQTMPENRIEQIQTTGSNIEII